MLSGSLRSNQRTTHRAFTLIELLVVIAIIAILAAILFPVFAQARGKARQAACMSNMKQMGLGVMQYSQDYDETLPYSEWGAGACGPQLSWQAFILPYIKNGQQDGGAVLGGVFQCPDALNNESGLPYLSNAPIYHYGAVTAFLPASYSNCNFNLPPDSRAKYPVAVGMLDHPADDIIIMDKGRNDAPWGYPWVCAEQWCVLGDGDPASVRDYSSPGGSQPVAARNNTRNWDLSDCNFAAQTGGGTWRSCGTSPIYRHNGTPEARPVGGAPRFKQNGGVTNAVFADGHVKSFQKGRIKFWDNLWDPGLRASQNTPYSESWYPW